MLGLGPRALCLLGGTLPADTPTSLELALSLQESVCGSRGLWDHKETPEGSGSLGGACPGRSRAWYLLTLLLTDSSEGAVAALKFPMFSYPGPVGARVEATTNPTGEALFTRPAIASFAGLTCYNKAAEVRSRLVGWLA